MNTEQLKQAALKATPGPWSWSDEYQARDLSDTWSLLGRGGYGILSCDGTGNSPHHTNPSDAIYIAAANPSTILALLECVDALRDMLKQFTKTPSTLKDSQARVKGHAALQKLEAL